MTSIRALLTNPAVVVGLVRALLILVTTFGVGLVQAQQDSILEAVGAFLAVASLVLTGVTTVNTTPQAKPVLPEGTVVEIVTAPGERNKVAVL